MPPKEERKRPEVSGHIDPFPLLELTYPKNNVCADLFCFGMICCAVGLRNIIFYYAGVVCVPLCVAISFAQTQRQIKI